MLLINKEIYPAATSVSAKHFRSMLPHLGLGKCLTFCHTDTESSINIQYPALMPSEHILSFEASKEYVYFGQ